MKTEEFEMYLRSTNLSENTISSYLFAVKQFFGQYDEVTKRGLRDHKIWLIESYKPKTVNLRIRAINCYLESIGKGEMKLQFVRVQQKAFLENVISEADYEYFKTYVIANTGFSLDYSNVSSANWDCGNCLPFIKSKWLSSLYLPSFLKKYTNLMNRFILCVTSNSGIPRGKKQLLFLYSSHNYIP